MKTLLSIILICGTASICLAAVPERPPPLTFDKHVDYLKWYDEFASKGRDPKENALDIYQKLSGDGKGNGGLKAPQGAAEEQLKLALKKAWSATDYPELKKYLDENEHFLVYFRQGSEKSQFWQTRGPENNALCEVLLPTLAPSRTASKALIAQSWMRGDGQAGLLFTNWQAILGNAKHYEQASLLITQLVGISERCMVYEQARAAVANNVLHGKSVTQAISVLQKNNSVAAKLIGPVMFEWASSLDTLQNVAPQGNLDKKKWSKIGTLSADGTPMESRPFDPKEANEIVEEIFPKLQDAAKGPNNRKRLNRLREFQQTYASKSKKNAFFIAMFPSFARADELMLRTEVQRRGTLLVLAIHAYKNKSKKWPEKLDDLEIDKLKTLRVDPYSGKDFVYKLTDKGPLLYSIASDGKDDGGRHDPKWGEGDKGGDYVFWPVPKE